MRVDEIFVIEMTGTAYSSARFRYSHLSAATGSSRTARRAGT